VRRLRAPWFARPSRSGRLTRSAPPAAAASSERREVRLRLPRAAAAAAAAAASRRARCVFAPAKSKAAHTGLTPPRRADACCHAGCVATQPERAVAAAPTPKRESVVKDEDWEIGALASTLILVVKRAAHGCKCFACAHARPARAAHVRTTEMDGEPVVPSPAAATKRARSPSQAAPKKCERVHARGACCACSLAGALKCTAAGATFFLLQVAEEAEGGQAGQADVPSPAVRVVHCARERVPFRCAAVKRRSPSSAQHAVLTPRARVAALGMLYRLRPESELNFTARRSTRGARGRLLCQQGGVVCWLDAAEVANNMPLRRRRSGSPRPGGTAARAQSRRACWMRRRCRAEQTTA
jgi:hypothetical protein